MDRSITRRRRPAIGTRRGLGEVYRPTVGNGRLYIDTQGEVAVHGLLP